MLLFLMISEVGKMVRREINKDSEKKAHSDLETEHGGLSRLVFLPHYNHSLQTQYLQFLKGSVKVIEFQTLAGKT